MTHCQISAISILNIAQLLLKCYLIDIRPKCLTCDWGRMCCGTPKNYLWAETASVAGWTLRLYNPYKELQQELATSIILILELFFVLFTVCILFNRELFFL